MRTPIGPRLRFAIFNRDDFTCRYCGRSSPDVVLHIDHTIPVSAGGTNHQANLVTACADCNLGKADRWIVNGAAELPWIDDDLQIMTCDPAFYPIDQFIE